MNLNLWAHWLHLMAAIIWVGGTFTISLAVQPVLRTFLNDQARFSIYREIGSRFKMVMWSSWTILLLTGIFKIWVVRDDPSLFLGPWGKILGVKLALVVCMVILSLLHTYVWGPQLMAAKNIGPNERKTLVKKMKLWGIVNLFILAGIIFCAAALRFSF